MNNFINNINLLPIPWMKHKLESIYETKILGKLFVLFNSLNCSDISYITSSTLHDLLNDSNIIVDDTHPLYIYIPYEVNELTKQFISIFKGLYDENVYIILGGYKDYYPTNNELDCISDLYMFYPNLINSIYKSYLIDTSKSYEIFTSLCDTHRICIDPKVACTLSGPTLNYHIKNNNASNSTHISLVKLLNECDNINMSDYYLKGLTNKNNNFNFNY